MLKKFIRFIAILAILVSTVGITGVVRANPASASLEAAAWFTNRITNITNNTIASDGTNVSIAFHPHTGAPYISYYDSTNGNLKLANPVPSGGNCGPNNYWSCQALDTTGDVGQFSSIAIYTSVSSQKWGIAYFDGTNRSLKFATRSCGVLCSSWTFITVDLPSTSTDYVGKYASLKFDSTGAPSIAYQAHLGSVYALYYAHYVSSGGNCGPGNTWKCDFIQGNLFTQTGLYPSLDLNGANKARIAYYDESGGNLMYAWATTSGGNCALGIGATWQCDTIDGNTGGNPDVGLYPSLHIDKGASDNPKIAYYDKTNGNLKYAEIPASNDTYECGPLFLSVHVWRCVPVESMGTGLIAHTGVSMAVDSSGYPLIAFQDATGDLVAGLKIARPAPAVGLSVGNCGVPLPGYIFLYWQCKTLDYGGAHSSVADYAAVGVSSSGMGMVAYSDYDDYNDVINLKIAYQQIQVFVPLIKR